MLEALLVSTAVVAVGELGDKTQLLTLVLAARYGRPWPIVAGIAVATLANHAIAGWVGNWARAVFPEDVLRWLLALSFFAVAAWALKPDKLDEGATPPASRTSVFLVTTWTFFLVEIGDKTQIATSLLAAQFRNIELVALGTTIGMMIANVPAVYLGEAITRVVPLAWVRRIAALLFALIGAWVLVDALRANGWRLPGI